MASKQTPSQTVGPFFAYGMVPEQYGYAMSSIASGRIADEHAEGERIRVEGRIFDGEGKAVPDAVVEVWQADARGRYAHPADDRGRNIPFKGFGRFGTGTDPEQRYIFETVKPGAVGDGQAPHLNLVVFMRGLTNHVYTRLYFADEAAANAADPVLALVPEARRATLIAERRETSAGPVYRLDIHMQGEAETVFFDL